MRYLLATHVQASDHSLRTHLLQTVLGASPEPETTVHPVPRKDLRVEHGQPTSQCCGPEYHREEVSPHVRATAEGARPAHGTAGGKEEKGPIRQQRVQDTCDKVRCECVQEYVGENHGEERQQGSMRGKESQTIHTC